MVYGVLGLINFANNAFMIGGAYLLILSSFGKVYLYGLQLYSLQCCAVLGYDHGGCFPQVYKEHQAHLIYLP